MAFSIREFSESMTSDLRELCTKYWGSSNVVSRGRLFSVENLPGFAAVDAHEQIVGFATYHIENRQCEVVMVASVREREGIGTALLQSVIRIAGERGCTRVWLVATNDNVNALRFYQKRGFSICALHRHALCESRKLKPEIPVTGNFGIPIEHEIELEFQIPDFMTEGSQPVREEAISVRKVINMHSTAEEKIALFRSLFRGREDVYPVRWTNKAGRSGYSPSCRNEWSAFCGKPKVKCSECRYQAFDPVTDEVISDHLKAQANRTIGVYPLLLDDTCWFLAMDFDKAHWQQDALAVMQTCQEYRIPAALERSRSGNGGHVWVFFDQPVLARIARELGSALLTKTMERRYQIPFESYDRLFPNQDTLPKGGFGNLIALPLQGVPRQNGNSVFVDEQMRPHEDQWSFLSGLERMSETQIQSAIQELTASSGLLPVSNWEEPEVNEPWRRRPLDIRSDPVENLPSSIYATFANMIYIEKKNLPSRLLHRIITLAAFQNPDFYKTQAMRLPTFGKPRIIHCEEHFPNHIAIPRGCLDAFHDLMEEYQITIHWSDERNPGQPIETNFSAELSMAQDGVVRTMLKYDFGVLSATTGFGKTVIAAAVIASRQVNTMILVHTKELLEQWKTRLQTLLSLDKEQIGFIGGGKERRTGTIDIAILQSLNRKGEIKSYLEEYGQIIVDECHHISAFSFEQVLKAAKAKYVLGLTATPKRKDGHHPIVLMQCGPIRMKIDAKSQISARGYEHNVIPRYTNFRVENKAQASIQDIYSLLIQDEARNTLIFDDVLKSLEQGRTPILLTGRVAHVDEFERRLASFVKHVIVLRSGMGKKQREALQAKILGIPENEERVYISTGKLVGEGFDEPRLDTLFLVHPISWRGTLEQYVGRLHRNHPSKTSVQVYDYVDVQVPQLLSMFRKRINGYRSMGYQGV